MSHSQPTPLPRQATPPERKHRASDTFTTVPLEVVSSLCAPSLAALRTCTDASSATGQDALDACPAPAEAFRVCATRVAETIVAVGAACPREIDAFYAAWNAPSETWGSPRLLSVEFREADRMDGPLAAAAACLRAHLPDADAVYAPVDPADTHHDLPGDGPGDDAAAVDADPVAAFLRPLFVAMRPFTLHPLHIHPRRPPAQSS